MNQPIKQHKLKAHMVLGQEQKSKWLPLCNCNINIVWLGEMSVIQPSFEFTVHLLPTQTETVGDIMDLLVH